ncbi:hypothetical protein QVD17_29949 [Tagetes erecta]|uniref:Uncharacterized protein n=1 Tax=Tagetes erecta TaxID=13708 RepID=A0AAD8K1V6_TARER|nr:hypothetical protein QVD17_29949 [Tagetes erecta]
MFNFFDFVYLLNKAHLLLPPLGRGGKWYVQVPKTDTDQTPSVLLNNKAVNARQKMYTSYTYEPIEKQHEACTFCRHERA